jgi:hypothetical protein
MRKLQYVTRFLGFAPSILAAALWATAALAQAPAPAAPGTLTNGDEKITVNFVSADIQSVIKTVGQHTLKVSQAELWNRWAREGIK